MIKGQITVTPDSGGAGNDQQLAVVAAQGSSTVLSTQATISGGGVEKEVKITQNKRMRAAILCGYEDGKHFNIYTFKDGVQEKRLTFDSSQIINQIGYNISFATQYVPYTTGSPSDTNFAICDAARQNVAYFDIHQTYHPFSKLSNASLFGISQVLSQKVTGIDDTYFNIKGWDKSRNSEADIMLDDNLEDLAAYYRIVQSGYENVNFDGNLYFQRKIGYGYTNWYFGNANGKPLICTFQSGGDGNKNWASIIDRNGTIEAMCIVSDAIHVIKYFISINGEIFISEDEMETWRSLGNPTFISESSQEEETMDKINGMVWYNGRLYFIGPDSYDTEYAILGYCEEIHNYQNWVTKTFPHYLAPASGPIWYLPDNKIQFFGNDTAGDYLYHFFTYDFDIDYSTTNYPGPDWNDPETSYGDGRLCKVAEIIQ